MDLTFYLLEHLKNHHRTDISDFGFFSLAHTGAAITSGQSILPPAKEIIFTRDRDLRNRDLVTYLAQQKNISEFEAELELKKFTNKYNSKYDAGENFELGGIGSFHSDGGKLTFKGVRISDPEPDFYGLEEIKLKEIHSSSPENATPQAEETESDYRFRKSILWIFLVAIPVIGLLVLGIRYPDFIFGKKSELTVKNSTHRIEKKAADSAVQQKPQVDSLASDSLKIHTSSSIPKK